MEIEIGYDYGYESEYPNPMKDWFLLVRVPKEKQWEDTRDKAQILKEQIINNETIVKRLIEFRDKLKGSQLSASGNTTAKFLSMEMDRILGENTV